MNEHETESIERHIAMFRPGMYLRMIDVRRIEPEQDMWPSKMAPIIEAADAKGVRVTWGGLPGRIIPWPDYPKMLVPFGEPYGTWEGKK